MPYLKIISRDAIEGELEKETTSGFLHETYDPIMSATNGYKTNHYINKK